MLVEELPANAVRLIWFVWGALWGSFFNVAIYRWPRDMSVVSPPSHCPSCGAPVPAWRNLPIVAYLWQRGRAACCGAKLTPRYVVVELLTALLAVAVAERFVVGSPGSRPMFDASIEALIYFTFVGGLVIATFVDLEHMQIPDEVSLGGTALGLATVLLREDVDVVSLSIGAGGAYLFTILVPVWAWERLTGQRGMGEGDAKLLMCIGAFVGWQGVLFVIAAASLQGTIGYLVQLAWRARMGEAAPPGEAKAEARAKADAGAKEEAKEEAKAEAKAEANAAAEAGPKAEAEAGPKTEAEAGPKVAAEEQPEAEASDSEAKPGTGSETGSASESESASESGTGTGSGSASESGTGSGLGSMAKATAADTEDDDRDVIEAVGEGAARAELEVDLPGKVEARATSSAGKVRVVLEYQPDLGAPTAPHIRFGPFLALAALEFLFFGNRIVDWYVETVFVID